MDIQDDSPLPVDPLAELDSDYGHAVLHLAWDRRQAKPDVRTLLFAFVELLPAEVPPPADDYDPRGGHRLGSGSDHHIYVRHAVTTARQALEWYLACRRGDAVVLPENDGTLPSGSDVKAKRLQVASFGEEPPWPALISAPDESDTLPFVPDWIRCPRTHHLLPLAEFDRDALWSKSEQDSARRWLTEHLHFDLDEYPEYWGSVHLIAPNPIYRQMHVQLQPGPPPAESVLLRIQPRAAKSLTGLELIFQEEDPWGVTTSRRATIQDPVVRLRFVREVKAVTSDIWDAHRGYLQKDKEAHPFCKTIHMGVGVMYSTVIKGDNHSYEVMRSGAPERITVGRERATASARRRMLAAHFRRKERRAAEAHGQRWFRDQKQEARDLLRGLLNEANRDVLLIDPYFGASELVEFTLAVGRDDIPIRILSSAEVLKKREEREALRPPPSEPRLLSRLARFLRDWACASVRRSTIGDLLEKGDLLLSALRQAEAHAPMNPFEIRVMTGDRPAVHDRFLAIDKRIWLLGSSLNEFGSRGTMMLALPNPDAVRDDLVKAWDEAQALDVWVEQRRKSRKGGSGESQ